jgi:hypothetical protein
MGFGYAVTATSLERPVRGVAAAWIGFFICLIGTVMAVLAILSGRASVLYTFYPPLLASSWYYFGAFLLIGGSMIWVVLMTTWRHEARQSGRPVGAACVRDHGDGAAVGGRRGVIIEPWHSRRALGADYPARCRSSRRCSRSRCR